MSGFSEALRMSYDEEIQYFYLLSMVSGFGVKGYKRAEEVFESPSEIFRSDREKLYNSHVFTEKQIERILNIGKNTDGRHLYEDMLDKGIRMLTLNCSEYPSKLKKIKDAPPFLFVKGRLFSEETVTVSVIGARECTAYGQNVARRLGELLATEGICLVSGMARGIDSIAQNAAVNAGGYSLAVLGGGVDICYPRESLALYERLGKTGGIVSEHAPGTAPLPNFFAARNRIISGLSDVICVVEAKEKSGTLITVDCALDQGREIFAVPGRITDITSFGTNELIRQGAGIISDLAGFVEDLTTSYGISRKEGKLPAKDISSYNLSKGEIMILSVVDMESFTPDLLSERLPIPSFEILGICVLLCTKGLLHNVGAGRFVPTDKGIEIRNRLKSGGKNTAI